MGSSSNARECLFRLFDQGGGVFTAVSTDAGTGFTEIGETQPDSCDALCHVVSKPAQTYEPGVPVEVRERRCEPSCRSSAFQCMRRGPRAGERGSDSGSKKLRPYSQPGPIKALTVSTSFGMSTE
jgi:hypothetical protein